MFAKLKNIFTSSHQQQNSEDDEEALRTEDELSLLESALSKNPTDSNTQKKLMVKYNQAIKIFSSRKNYRHRVDDLFIRMDELRNTIRRNI
ncbi:hypothetical protein J3D56_000831 [Erwinia persicina]|jgi:hypothetical protein|uniref:hypothetical protein n=1 Tax=Erwinia TaxID=551 RepID=UPI00209F09E5|nr:MULTISPECIES: hypothetical protein [Erwinia]MCP1437395.1 hypothetical protein [Erwinia persicina]MDN4626310.1 hypothetical protein [Erwinia sp. PsM31]MDN8540765.1 hypothetical protein [Erwinia sp. BC051422]